MSLSDTCFDAIADLKNDFHFYIGWRPYIRRSEPSGLDHA